ncbi:hypothetical protein TRFO_25245 [Tritrichomonas foetus]|uniref:Uncharacterized protein n=1 Tax=Tritrichomonas foetus TaxID=1144522 RepID=A0A1J4KAE4_9EUKA|nr:hypothetical protein TRFO_25245 [Tritrichomonas foetus]|eukprot:OHT06638.1 hypothetical protein TRFO_25245 [Tritrichomonas foetus]
MSSKKKARTISGKGKKGVDETEKLVAGNGWTTAATAKYLECQTDEERLQQLFAMFSISEDDYKYNFKATATIDFHFGNAVYCQEANFDANKLQFFCRSLHKLLETGISRVQEDPNLDYEALRGELFEQFRTLFTEFNQPDFIFTTQEASELIKYVTVSFLRPLRLILHPHYLENHTAYFLEMKKVFRPMAPVPLSECEEIRPIIPEEEEFPILALPRDQENLDLATMRQIIKQYTDEMVKAIDKRYDTLEEQMAKVNPVQSP